VLAELFRHGARTVMLLSGHGENQFFLFEAADLALADTPGGKVLVTGWWQLVPDALINELFEGKFPGWDLEHAATVETSLMLALDPSRVRRNRIQDSRVERVPRYSTFPQPPGLVPATGLLSDARPATRAMGERLVETVVAGLAAILEAES
jgi:creatinine amidohydrolase